MANTQQEHNNGLKLTLAWLFVGIPLAWGVIETLLHSLKLFE
ncbi:MAG: oxalate:formate antiporter [Alphaproteobacteria bacterium]|nr:oxalate:formate antiporter [Alphaproteobacteria bacterium]MDE1968830.1 oxalate:formate antiporter [Alphaproteobacteria bacterium]